MPGYQISIVVNVIQSVITFVNSVKIILLPLEPKTKIESVIQPCFSRIELYLNGNSTSGNQKVNVQFLSHETNLSFFSIRVYKSAMYSQIVFKQRFKRTFNISQKKSQTRQHTSIICKLFLRNLMPLLLLIKSPNLELSQQAKVIYLSRVMQIKQ